jgi:hypothetical protein
MVEPSGHAGGNRRPGGSVGGLSDVQRISGRDFQRSANAVMIGRHNDRQAGGSAMQCPYCRGTIFNGAFVCRFCGKKQPVPAAARIPGRVIFGSLAFICVLVVWANWQGTDAQHEQARIQQAAACNGTMTAQQIADSAKATAAKSHISIMAAVHSAEILACPTMAGH